MIDIPVIQIILAPLEKMDEFIYQYKKNVEKAERWEEII